VRLRLVDDQMNDVPLGAVGEIATRCGHTMSGYEGMPERTAEAFRDGWFRAGDLARQDAEGYLYLAGRSQEMIIRGGENIYPLEVETVLMEHPAVGEAAVVGRSDPRWGEVVVAFVRVSAPVSPDDLVAHCRDRLARFKVPAEVVLVDGFPRNSSGKVLKRALLPTSVDS
jgi:acyl-CoA synthetase (AMP-forming)/AMP-acid ligase II